jgi:bacterial/archaeal transporter family protein
MHRQCHIPIIMGHGLSWLCKKLPKFPINCFLSGFEAYSLIFAPKKMWVFWGLLSALLLGLYDVSRKVALKENAVIPVLFFASATGAVIFLPLVVFSRIGSIDTGSLFYIPAITQREHVLFFAKSLLVGSSWFFAYFAISQLPLTIVIPIRSTGPMWTLFGALIIYSERFTFLQWVGIIVVLCFFYVFSLAGKREGIEFRRNKWILAIVAATLLGATSSLYDKYLIPRYDRMAVQAWFSIYMVPVFLPFLLGIWYPKRKSYTPFVWNGYIHMVGILLILADFFYFYALTHPDAKIALLSVLRRSSVVISFVSGALFFKERNLKRKGLALIGILAGVLFIVLGTL